MLRKWRNKRERVRESEKPICGQKNEKDSFVQQYV